jgi:hypothetical protein
MLVVRDMGQADFRGTFYLFVSCAKGLVASEQVAGERTAVDQMRHCNLFCMYTRWIFALSPYMGFLMDKQN